MRVFSRLLACLVLCFLVCSARATRINILDPTTPPLITPVTSTPFDVTFSAASCGILLPNASQSEMGCFGFLNRTSSDWVGLELTLASNDPTMFSFTCNDLPPAAPVFGAVTSCGYNATKKEYDLFFTAGVIPDNTRQYFVITEDDLPADALEFTATPVFASTPEPPALLLLSTGLLCAGALAYSRRRADA